ncbi:methionine gamma-lyase family protein [Clostridium sp. 'deep sea']|uniref:methionine gamma-lyase family protein n=1 Tax=Clostridium sp. 'deep sea' TaxID=2779445 RepID=UPI0018969DC8|nr:methionine gamma-lyase family protein [Clostridium sp. 'deep sea']QOR35762.1 methionine gamma-lyase family protein [Clostridium sp. 'deep sea']
MSFLALKEILNVNNQLLTLADNALLSCEQSFKEIRETARYNQARVLKSFQEHGVTDMHLQGSTGYGYSDLGRDTLDEIYAEVFYSESAVVRGQFVSGTHAISAAMQGLLLAGDELIFAGGYPYDTLHKVVGWTSDSKHSLLNKGVKVKVINTTKSGDLDTTSIVNNITAKTKMVHFQRSRGYTTRRAWSCAEVEPVFKAIKKVNPNIIIFVDNCYGEFVEKLEPTSVGADVMAGSLIKNPGGGLALWGGYIVGKEQFINDIMDYCVAPGLGRDMGGTQNIIRSFYHGLFLAPHVVGQALMGAVFAANIFEKLNLTVDPKANEQRYDIIQSVNMKNKEQLIAFCEGIQKGSPVDSMANPIPGMLPGYDHEVIMAAGTFIQGASIEFSADAPVIEPYTVYMQGGQMLEHIELGIITALNHMIKKGVLEV